MATIAPTTAGVVEVLEVIEQSSPKTCAADIVGGTFVREDTNGNWVQALATTAANGRGCYLALRSAKAGEALTGLKTGKVAGFTISQAYDAQVFLSDTGTVADAAGTVSIVAGRVMSLRANLLTAAADKGLLIDCPAAQ
jgi:hypothetical protein